jgi:hypothetical protein
MQRLSSGAWDEDWPERPQKQVGLMNGSRLTCSFRVHVTIMSQYDSLASGSVMLRSMPLVAMRQRQA